MKTWTLEYNQDQKKFHIQKEKILKGQISIWRINQDLGENCVFIGRFDSYKECEKFKREIIIRSYKKKIKKLNR